MARSLRRLDAARLSRRLGLGLIATVIALPAGAAAACAIPSSPPSSEPAFTTSAGPSPTFTLGRQSPGLRFSKTNTPAHRALVGSPSVGPSILTPTPSTSLPAAADLRTSGYLPVVGQQGNIGTCATWTIAHTIMGYYAAKAGESGAPYSPLYLWSEQTRSTDPTAGTTAVGDLTQARNSGVDTEADYWQGWYGYQQNPSAAEESNATKYRITGYQVLWQGINQSVGAKQQLLEAALAAGNPVAVGFEVHSSFENLTHLTTESALDPESGSDLGGHMVTAVGYDSTGLVLRNQWGTAWGHNGDLKVTWAWVENEIREAYTVSGVTSPADSGIHTADAPVLVSAASTSSPVTVGSTLTLTGSNLAAATAVSFGGRPATFTRVTGNGTTTLQVTVPAGTTGGAVTVSNSGGTSAPIAISTTPAPSTAPTGPTTPTSTPAVVSSVSPLLAPASVSTEVTVTGSGLDRATAVSVGGSPVPFARITASTLAILVPAGTPGAAAVVVTTSSGPSNATVAFTRTASGAPTITSLSLNAPAGRASRLGISGTGLASTRSATIGGSAVSGTISSDSQVFVNVPALSPGTYPLSLTTAGGTVNATVTVS